MSSRSVRAKLAGFLEDARDGGNKGLRLGAEHVLGVSNQTVPIEEGTLGRSGKVTQDEAQLRAAVSYDTPYAVRQHEDLTLAHDSGRHAKFLENAVNGERTTVGRLIATSIRRETGL